MTSPRRAPLRVLLPLSVALAAVVLTAAPSLADRPWPGHPDRRLHAYTVRPGDTGAGIATRFHAWTRELERLNGRGHHATWRAGERIQVPVVVSRAAPKHRLHGRAKVRAAVVRAARKHDVPPRLALAVAWQESGWQQHVRSSVGAVGTMQVMPGNAQWLSTLLGRRLHLHRLQDNAEAGVLLISVLRQQHGVRRTLAAYYQGDGSIADHGLYRDTRQYVANVLAHRERLSSGWDPTGR